MRLGFIPMLICGFSLISCFGRVSPPIGFVGPLTGPSSAVGLGARNGFLMAMGDGPGAAPGRIGKARLIVADDANDPDKCLEAFRQLKDEGCRLVILATTSQAATKAIPWAMDEGILVLSPTVSNPSFSGADDLFIRINAASEAYGIKLAEVAFERFGKRRVAVVGDSGNELYRKAVSDAFSTKFAGLGGEVPFELAFQSSQGLPTERLLGELKRGRADGLIVVTASTQAALIAKFMQKAGIRITMFLPPWPLTLDLIKNGGKAVEGSVAISIADMEYRSKAGAAFHSGYLAEYGEEPSFTAMFGYEAASILRSALAAGARPEAVPVKDLIIRTREYPGLQGGLSFDKNGDATRELFLFTIIDGRFKRIDG